MGDRLAGKVAIVTGAASGNGRAIARAFADEGALVACADLNEAGARAVAADIGGKAIAIGMNVADAADCARTVDQTIAAFGGLDVLVNNAGILIEGTILDTDEAAWDRLMGVNLRGVYLLTRAALPKLIERGGGSVIMVASLAGLRARARMTAYVTSKHAVVGMTKALAIDHGPRGIRVNAICPGPIETAMTEGFYTPRAGQNREEVRAARGRTLPLGRVGQPEDVARVAVHLASDEAAWVTGLCYSIDGGSGLGARIGG